LLDSLCEIIDNKTVSLHHDMAAAIAAEEYARAGGNFSLVMIPHTLGNPAVPILVRGDAPFSRENIVKYLEKRKIPTRMLFGGNLLNLNSDFFRD
jgi:hypothetical protein